MAQITDPIAVFDSGMGGISVLKEMTRMMPKEDFIYFGDSLHAPYGTKTTEEVRQLTIGHIADFIENKHAKAIAVACNTATSAAVRILREMYPDVPLVGVEPAIKPAVLDCKHPRVLVMATPVTLKEEKFHNLEAIYDAQADIIPVPCPGLMEFIEQGILEGEELDSYLKDKLSPYLHTNITGIVLGCTHYPFVKKDIQAIVGPSVKIFDGSFGTAKELRRRVTEAGLLRSDEHAGTVAFLNSSDDPDKIRLSEYLYSI
ncbi:MAG: glutamate racemase [Clostridiales bacterium]|nr:glutamate racemase [Clostridiales bacterium]